MSTPPDKLPAHDTDASADPSTDAVAHADSPAGPSAPAGSATLAADKPAVRKPAAKSPRRRARELALQGLYQWLVSGEDAGVVDAHMREQEDFAKCDSTMFDALLHGCIAEATAIDAVLARHVDRRTDQLSPVEHGVLMIGVWELMHSIEVPYRVVINEAVEVTKAFGGTDGHRYVNGVLDKAAADLRPVEVKTPRAPRGARPPKA